MSDIKEILSKYNTIAMVGVSNDPTKASTIVMKYMQEYGYKVYPVNPRAEGQKILGQEVFAKISDIKDQIDIVDVFRPSKEVYAIAEDTIKIGKQAFYKQLEMPLNKAYAYTSKMMTFNMMAMDAKEGISAFLEKRKPNWKNK